MQITRFMNHERSLREGIIGRAGVAKKFSFFCEKLQNFRLFSKEFPFMPFRREYSREKRRFLFRENDHQEIGNLTKCG